MAIVIAEILQDKIYLDVNNEVKTRSQTAQETVREANFSSYTD